MSDRRQKKRKNSAHMSVTFEAEVYNYIAELADEIGLSFSAQLNILLRETIKRKKSQAAE